MVVLAAALALAFPTGTYARNVTAADLARQRDLHGMCRYCDPPATGTWRLTVRGGRLTLVGPDRSLATERYSAGSRRVRLAAHSSVCRLPGNHFAGGTGTYAWKRVGFRLVLRVVRDTCADRAAILAGSWIRTR